MDEVLRSGRESARAGVVMGLATTIFGVLCLFAPGLSGLGVTMFVAVLMIAAGIARLVYAFKAKSFGKGLLTFLFGGLSILVGVVMLARPLVGLQSMTMVLAAFFIADGIVEIIMAFKVRPAKGWGWMLFGGAVSLILAALIIYEWPYSGEWAIGILLGVRLILAGTSMIALGAMGEGLIDEVERAAS